MDEQPTTPSTVPDDVQLDRFRPRLPAPSDAPGAPSPDPDGPAAGPTPGARADVAAWTPLSVPPVAEPEPVQPQPAQPVSTWDEWSHHERDTRERASLVNRLRGERAGVGIAHEQATAAHLRRLGAATAVTIVTGLVLAGCWVMIILAREDTISEMLDARPVDRTFIPFGFLLLAITILAALRLLRWWALIIRTRPDPLRFDPLPDSPDAPRHGSFDGSTTPPTRW